MQTAGRIDDVRRESRADVGMPGRAGDDLLELADVARSTRRYPVSRIARTVEGASSAWKGPPPASTSLR